MRLLYKTAANILGPVWVFFAFLRGRFGGRWKERLGFIENKDEGFGATPRYWFHGASVGEAHTAAAVIEALLEEEPEAEIYLSIGTPLGLERAKTRVGASGKVTVLAPPLDFWGAPKRFVNRLKPKAVIIVETELWPNLIEAVSQSPARLVLAAGRLTAKSFKRYSLVKNFMRNLLSKFDLLAMASPEEARRVELLGAPSSRVHVLGTPKYDRLIEFSPDENFQKQLSALKKKLWASSGSAGPLWVAGSTHAPEEKAVLEAYRLLLEKHSSLGLVIAPRHLKRSRDILKMASEGFGLSSNLFSSRVRPLLNGPGVVILDKAGSLEQFYALAAVALVGGSLFGGHGHNPLEPAAYMSPMIFGFYMDSFTLESQGLLKAEGALDLGPLTEEQMPSALAGKVDMLLSSPGFARRMGASAKGHLEGMALRGPGIARAILSL